MTDLLDLAPAPPRAFVPRLTEPALRNADVLRRLAIEPTPPNVNVLAGELGRDESNLRKTLRTLIEGGVLAGEGVPTLTDFGRDQLDRIEAAERGSAPVPAGYALLTFAQIEGDPGNARTDSGLDVEGIDELAASIAAVGFLQPPTVRPADERGVHRLVFGHRRWLAWGRLIDKATWLPMHTVLCPVREGDDAALTEAGIIENAQRTDLTNLEYAEAFAKLAALYRAAQPTLPAAELERLIGSKIHKTPRYVGQLLQVAEKASEADKQRFRDAEAARARGEKADYYWTNLRESVQERKAPPLPIPDLSPKLTLALVELADAQARWKERPFPGLEGFAKLVAPPTGGPLPDLSGRKLIDLKIHGGHVGAAVRMLATPAGEHLRALGFDDDRAACLYKVRSAVVGELAAGTLMRDDRYHTSGVVPPPPTTPANLFADELAPAPTPAAETQPPAPRLSGRQRLILVQVAFLAASVGGPVPIDAVPSDDGDAQALLFAKFLAFGARAAGGFHVSLTPAAEAYLQDELDVSAFDTAGLEEAQSSAIEDLAPGEDEDVAWLHSDAAQPEPLLSPSPEAAAPRAPSSTDRLNERLQREHREREDKREADYAAIAPTLPDDEAGLLAAGDQAARDYDAAVLFGDHARKDTAAERYDAIARKLNGGDFATERDQDAGGPRLRRHLAAPDGLTPHWGQPGRFLVQARGVRAVFVYDGLGGWGSIYAVDYDRPFPSETGYQSFAGELRDRPGRTVRDVATELMAGQLDRDARRQVTGLVPIETSAAARAKPPAWLTPELEAEAAALDPQPNGKPEGPTPAEAAAEAAKRDNAAVDDLAKAMKAKLSAAREKGRGGWHDPAQCSLEDLSAQLLAHVGRGDPIDVANFCAFLFSRRDARTHISWDQGRLRWTADALREQADLALGVAALAVDDVRERGQASVQRTTDGQEFVSIAPVAETAFQALHEAAAAWRASLEQAS